MLLQIGDPAIPFGRRRRWVHHGERLSLAVFPFSQASNCFFVSGIRQQLEPADPLKRDDFPLPNPVGGEQQRLVARR